MLSLSTANISVIPSASTLFSCTCADFETAPATEMSVSLVEPLFIIVRYTTPVLVPFAVARAHGCSIVT